jgi:hypothetical protein
VLEPAGLPPREPAVAEHEAPPPSEPAVAEHEAPPASPISSGRDVKISVEKGSAYGDLPDPETPTKEPFGDPNGWSDTHREGEPWATSVMDTLDAERPVALLESCGDCRYRFKLKVCRDGAVAAVGVQQGTGEPERDAEIRAALEQLHFDPMPKAMSRKLKLPCVWLNFTFVWSGGAAW